MSNLDPTTTNVDIDIMEVDPKSSTLLASTSTILSNLTRVDKEESE